MGCRLGVVRLKLLPSHPALFSRRQTFLQLLYTLQGKLQSPETEAELPQDLDLPGDKSQLLTSSREQTRGDTMGRDGRVFSKVSEKWDKWAWRQGENLGEGA